MLKGGSAGAAKRKSAGSMAPTSLARIARGASCARARGADDVVPEAPAVQAEEGAEEGAHHVLPALAPPAEVAAQEAHERELDAQEGHVGERGRDAPGEVLDAHV